MIEPEAMLTIFLAVGLLIVVTIFLALYRAIAGPEVFNRVAAVNVIGTKTIVLLVIIGYIFERPLFFDISLLYALLNFIGTGKCDTLGEVLIILGLLIYHIFYYNPGAELWVQLVPVKLLFLIAFIFLANPTATHAIMKAAYNTGLKPWKKGDERM